MANFLYTKKDSAPSPRIKATLSPRLEESLGRGLMMPPELLNDTKWIALAGSDKIKQDMAILLSTPVGRRFLRPDYGSMLPHYLFKRMNVNLIATVQNQVETALKKYMSFIVLKEVRVSKIENAEALAIQIAYMIAGTEAEQVFKAGLGQPDQLKTLPPEFFRIDGRPLFKESF